MIHPGIPASATDVILLNPRMFGVKLPRESPTPSFYFRTSTADTIKLVALN